MNCSRVRQRSSVVPMQRISLLSISVEQRSENTLSLFERSATWSEFQMFPHLQNPTNINSQAKRISSAWAGMKASSQQGMFNPGVLCYRNSLLQALLHQPKFVHWIVRSHQPDDCECLSLAFCHLASYNL